jgi:hypothetical protein
VTAAGRDFTVNKFVGDAETCFTDLLDASPGLRMHRLIAAFCSLEVEAVQRWETRKHFPAGLNMLRLQCFLQLTGYEVTGLTRLKRNWRRLAFAIALGLLDVDAIAKELYKGGNTQQLWEVLLHGGGYQLDTEVKIRGILARQLSSAAKESLNDVLSDLDKKTVQVAVSELDEIWRARIAKLQASFRASASVAPQQVVLVGVDPGVAASFAGLVRATSAFAGALADDSSAHQQVLDTTRGGADMQELIDVLWKLLHPEG